MGLSEEDKKSHPYYKEKQLKEEKERWEEFTKSLEYVKIAEKFHSAFEDYLHQLILGDFYAKDLKVNVEQVASATSYWMIKVCDSISRTRFYLTEKMLERFDLVKKKKK